MTIRRERPTGHGAACTPFFQLAPDERRRWFDVVAAVVGQDERLEIAVRKAIDDAVNEAMPDAFDIADRVRAALEPKPKEMGGGSLLSASQWLLPAAGRVAGSHPARPMIWGRMVGTRPGGTGARPSHRPAGGGQRMTDSTARRRSPILRFFDKVSIQPEGCWLWTGAKTKPVNGYGLMGGPRRVSPRLVHRLAHEWFVGPIPAGWQVDHLCRAPLCVNPLHLEAVTPAENCHRSLHPSALAHACKRCTKGHPYTPENGRVGMYGKWRCWVCIRERDRQRYRTEPEYRRKKIERSRAQKAAAARSAM